ncbi:MAG: hypothetical protein K8S55_13245 [Phycisphaerae bacterium]|nr:hypothetical protein [Phycisphaerae bacterium]
MKNEVNEIMLSQLADGELDSDQTNELLLDVLDDGDARQQLKEHLQLRQSLGAWRRQKPAGPVALSAHRQREIHRHHSSLFWRMGSMAAAAMIGGVLMLAGFWAANRINQTGQPGLNGQGLPVAVVTAEQMRQVAGAFALHESVAGPLKWYAADDQRIQMASAETAETGHKPVAVLLRMTPAANSKIPAKTYVIVCRDNQPATIDLPRAKGASTVRLQLLPVAKNGDVEMNYTLVISDVKHGRQSPAILAGRQKVSLDETSLGQVSLDNQLVNVNASAWAIRDK